MFPLLSELPNVYFYACDFSPRAVQFVKVSSIWHIHKLLGIYCGSFGFYCRIFTNSTFKNMMRTMCIHDIRDEDKKVQSGKLDKSA